MVGVFNLRSIILFVFALTAPFRAHALIYCSDREGAGYEFTAFANKCAGCKSQVSATDQGLSVESSCECADIATLDQSFNAKKSGDEPGNFVFAFLPIKPNNFSFFTYLRSAVARESVFDVQAPLHLLRSVILVV